MAKEPKWLREGQRLKIDAEIAFVAEDGSYFAVDLAGHGRVRYDTTTMELLIEQERAKPED